ncbi:hypothetical protein L1987_71833 [Smallanthus sonchifolius]|uniref:Uncharacterized protein n=1 Tax=Smallanthus sonchifolius TaxID=185202 RepID=A0ACB9AUD4_9ASTR|nr:hypothetical protein L1987_71833 [Smallanthus sonchifolius]
MGSWNSMELKILSTVLGERMGSWNSMELKILSTVFGWIASIRSSAVQTQYHNKYGFNQIIPVAANDVAFSSHAVLLTAFTLFQITIYDRGTQKVSRITMVIVLVAWTTVAICVCVAMPKHSWLWLVSCFNMLQVSMTVIKYIPQAIMNSKWKSTIGFRMDNILLDLLGGLTNYGQMAVQSIDQHSWVNFYGNIGKTLLSLVSIFFDFLFIVQHFLLYPVKKTEKSPSPDPGNHESLIISSQNV